MLKEILDKYIEVDLTNSFRFRRGESKPTEHLRMQTQNVPDKAGLYLVYTINDSIKSLQHLKFIFDCKPYTLLYFGKAGGLKKNGGKFKQGLKGRLNNVVSDSSMNLKDIKRADYWEKVMVKNDFEEFLTVYFVYENPQDIENEIYSFLDNEKLQYPLMNKKRGRRKVN